MFFITGHPSRAAVAFATVTAVQAVRSSANQSRKQPKLSSPLKSTKLEKEEELKEKMGPIISNLADFLRSNDYAGNEQVRAIFRNDVMTPRNKI